MKQHINFYQDQFRAPIIQLSAQHIFLLLAGSLLFIVITSASLAAFNYSRNAHAQAYQESLTAMEHDVQTMQAAIQTQKVDVSMQRSVRAAELRMERKRLLLSHIQQPMEEPQAQFSVLLKGLAEQVPMGLWVDHFYIHSKGNELLIEGATSSASALPQFLADLSRSVGFNGRDFRTVMAMRDEKNSGQLNFVLATETIKDEELKMIAWIKENKTK
ncbi:MAG: PilN domain-containing protein [Gammaproteobacteria bacterium]|nr:PilN domain-containing protein [Gammaproteobacteria bacterium]